MTRTCASCSKALPSGAWHCSEECAACESRDIARAFAGISARVGRLPGLRNARSIAHLYYRGTQLETVYAAIDALITRETTSPAPRREAPIVATPTVTYEMRVTHGPKKGVTHRYKTRAAANRACDRIDREYGSYCTSVKAFEQ